MGEEDLSDSAVYLDTTVDFRPDSSVPLHMQEGRAKIRKRLHGVFESLPDTKTTFISFGKYFEENPQAFILVPEKDMNMFPVVIAEAKKFAGEFRKKMGPKDIVDKIRDHEFEHLQKIYELGIDVKGIGFLMFKYKGAPAFGGFVAIPEEEEVSLRDELRVRVAPRTLAFANINDMVESGNLLLEAISKASSYAEVNDIISDLIFVVGERYLPKKVHNFIQGLDDKQFRG